MKSHRRLRIWQLAIALIRAIYHATRGFPREEIFGLKAQLRRAAVSVATNIAEGNARFGPGEAAHGLSMAIGSLAELDTLIVVCEMEGYLEPETARALETQSAQLCQLMLARSRKMRAAMLKRRL